MFVDPAPDPGCQGARLEADGSWVWEEQDYCVPPLAMERTAHPAKKFTG